MLELPRARLLRFLRLPPDPAPPAGAPGSIRTFRAGRNFFRLALLSWGIAQGAALIGILFSLTMLWQVQGYMERINSEPPPATQPGSPRVEPPASAEPAQKTENARPPSGKRPRSRDGGQRMARNLAPYSGWVFPAIKAFEAIGILIYLVQLVATFLALRLNYELRWYMVTDRSLRIRSGVWNLQEVTMSFANLQQVEVSQGPLQRILGLADVRVQSAGGGAGEQTHSGAQQDSLHTGVFQGVTNAAEIRDLIIERLRVFREAGLGDPDDVPAQLRDENTLTARAVSRAGALSAARELLAEARALRGTS